MNRRAFIALLGGAAACPLPLRAQQQPIPVIGFLSGRSPEDSTHLLESFRGGLKEGGFVEGQNLAIEFRWARGEYGKLSDMARDLVSRQVSVLAALGGEPSALAAKRATATIPIVFGIGGDPVAVDLVESLNRPGGNATGYTLLTNEMEPKRLGLLSELVPGVALIGALVNPNFPPAVRQLADLEEAARSIGQRILVAKAANDVELDGAFAALTQQRIGALLIAADPYFDSRREKIIAFAQQQRLPAMYQFREFAVAGGLISYGPKITDGYQQAGLYVARLLKGAKPVDLPVFQPTKFEFVINLKTAKAIGLAVPPGLSARADEVIE